MKSLSVIILSLNEETNIRECLASVRWANEVVVVDSQSTDNTVAIAEQCGATVLGLPWEGYGGTKNRALEKTTGDWILWLDADERVTEPLSEEIRTILSMEETHFSAFSMPRRAFFLGKWIKHAGWYPGRVVRLFRREAGRFTEPGVHEGLEITGQIGQLTHDLIHLTDPNLQHYFSKFNRYTTLAAEDLQKRGKRFHVLDLLVHPLFTFFKMYILKQGFRDGLHGFVLCVVSGLYVFVKYAKLWEREQFSSNSSKS